MLRKLIAVLVPLIVVLATAPAAGAKAKTEVSIYPWPAKGAFGFVESKKPRLCSKNRQVNVWKVVDGRAKRIGRARVVKRTGGFTWSIRNRRAASGTIGVTAVRTSDCMRARAKRKQMPRSGVIPPCPSYADICHLERLHIEDTVAPLKEPDCSMWLPDQAHRTTLTSECSAEVSSGPIPFCCWTNARVEWRKYEMGDVARHLTIRKGSDNDPKFPVIFSFQGALPKSDSARYTITRARIPYWRSEVEWFTPDIAGAGPGTMGGPIYFNIEPGSFRGFDIYIGGFLYRR